VIYLFGTVHVIVCIFLILVVLLQQGKGADLSVFGGGSTQAAFGARSAATLLHKLTVGSFIAFIVTTMGIAVLQGSRETSSVMSDVKPPVSAPATPAPATSEPAAPVPAPPAAEQSAPATATPVAPAEAPPSK
jgi:preprotein translocase subunit SecG